jgi:ABC-2 type transport system ATP-binding protein
MRRRLDLAAGLIGDPEVVFLDEPTTGLDPRGRQATWGIIQSLCEAGVTVLLTTQYLDEADALADRIAILDEGRIVAEGSSSELKRRVGGQRLVIKLTDDQAFEIALAQLGERATHSDRHELSVSVSVARNAAVTRELLDELDPGRQRIKDFSRHEATLDDAFMSLTGHNTGRLV